MIAHRRHRPIGAAPCGGMQGVEEAVVAKKSVVVALVPLAVPKESVEKLAVELASLNSSWQPDSADRNPLSQRWSKENGASISRSS